MQFGRLKRREFIAVVGSAAAWPFVADAAASRPRVGVLTLASPRDEGGRIAAFVAGMRELGYVPGQTLNIDYRYAEGDNERLPLRSRHSLWAGYDPERTCGASSEPQRWRGRSRREAHQEQCR